MKKLILAAVIGGLVVLGGVKLLGGRGVSSAPASAHPAFDRVMATRTLRCAYAPYDPFIVISTDGKVSGIFHDIVDEAAKRLMLKVNWAEEVGYGNINTGFMTGRYDAFCAGLWPSGNRAPSTIFSHAAVWDPVGVWVRSDDHRFDGNIEKLDDPAYKIADMDGDATVAMANLLFPKAGRVTMSQNQTIGEEIEQVTTRKADADFRDYLAADRWLKTAPGSIRNLSPDKPVLIYPLTVGFNQGETALRDMFDVVLDDMNRDGTIARIVKSYLGAKSDMLFHKKAAFEPY